MRSRLSTTGKNVANIEEEFKINPIKCKSEDIRVTKREIPEYGAENMELLERLFNSRAAEIEPNLISELNELIDNICEE